MQPECIQRIILAGVPQLDVNDWKLCYEDFFRLVGARKSSAPGPDGISFGCIQAAGHFMIKPMYNTYLSWLSGECLPKAWNIAWLWLLLKGDDIEGKYAGYRFCKDTRPLSGSNCTAKVFPATIVTIADKSETSREAVTDMQEGMSKVGSC